MAAVPAVTGTQLFIYFKPNILQLSLPPLFLLYHTPNLSSVFKIHPEFCHFPPIHRHHPPAHMYDLQYPTFAPPHTPSLPRGIQKDLLKSRSGRARLCSELCDPPLSLRGKAKVPLMPYTRAVLTQRHTGWVDSMQKRVVLVLEARNSG